MAAAFKPAGFSDDSDDEDGFMFGDEDYKAVNSKNGSEGHSLSGSAGTASSAGFGTACWSRSSSVVLEDFKMALRQGNLKTVQEILDRGVDVNAQCYSNGWSFLMYAGNCAKVEIFKLLLDKGANPNYHKDLYTVLMATCESNSKPTEDVVECVQLLLDRGIDVNAYDRYHTTPLMYATKMGSLDMVQLLLDRGANINSQDSRGWTALSWATHREHLGVVKLLLQRGADKHKKHSDNLTAIDLARGKEEVVWLFEGRPAGGIEIGAGDADSPTALTSSSSINLRNADLKYGHLEIFLSGLNLGQFHPVFLKHQVDFPLLLTLNEEDLTNMGITEVGVRKKLLEGVAAVHKKNWETSSLVPIRLRNQITCPDAIAIIANLSLHLRYISSSVIYVKDHVKHKADFLTISQDGSGPKQLLLHTGDGVKNVAILQQELTQLYNLLHKELKNTDFSPPDFIPPKKRTRNRVRSMCLALSAICMSSVVLFVWKRDFIVDSAAKFLSPIRLKFSHL